MKKLVEHTVYRNKNHVQQPTMTGELHNVMEYEKPITPQKKCTQLPILLMETMKEVGYEMERLCPTPHLVCWLNGVTIPHDTDPDHQCSPKCRYNAISKRIFCIDPDCLHFESRRTNLIRGNDVCRMMCKHCKTESVCACLEVHDPPCH